jgi:hypothetical protein
MPSLSVNYVTYGRAGRRRHAAADGGHLSPTLNSTPVPGTTSGVYAYAIANYRFAFWSITGEDAGARVSNAPAESVLAGSSALTATAWYIPIGDGPPGPPGYDIDSFDVDNGRFFDWGDFVTCSDASLTFNANDLGWVPTSSAAEAIHAIDPCSITAPPHSPAATPFNHWQIIDGNATAAANVLTAPRNDSGIAFAMFHSPTPPNVVKPNINAMLEWLLILGGVIYDGPGIVVGPGGGGGPVGPWGPMIARLSPGVREAFTGLVLADAAGALTDRAASAQLRKVGLGIATAAIRRLGAAKEQG